MFLSGWADLNCQPLAPHASALANCATPRIFVLYQTYLEKKWLEALRLKHKIVINEDVLYQIGQ